MVHRWKPKAAVAAGLLFVGFGTGCQTGLTNRPITTGEELFPAPTQVQPQGRAASGNQVVAGLLAAHDQVHSPDPSPARGAGTPYVLSSGLAQSSLMRKLIDVNADAFSIDRARSATTGAPSLKPVSFTESDFTDFLKTDLQSANLQVWSSSVAGYQARAADRNALAMRRIQSYMIAYFDGKFVDRRGTPIAKPAVKDGAISNDTITGFLTVFFEAVDDSLFRVPVYFEMDANNKRKWLNPGEKEPTVAALSKDANGAYDAEVVRNIASDTEITTDELHAIQFASAMASEQSKALSGFVFRIFSDMSLSFVVGGNFAFGNNDTAAKVVDCFFEVSSRRTTEALAYRYFSEHSEKDYGAGLKELIDLIKYVYDRIK